MNKNLTNKLTFLVLLKERREFTLRFFEFLKKTKFPFKVFFSDGSKKKLPHEFFERLKSSNINYTYKKFPHDKNYATFQKKVLDSIKLIKTEYICFFSDDDFPIINSYKKLIKFLEKNNSYVACGGYAINFDLFKKFFNPNNVYGHPINFQKIMFKSSNNHKNKFKRLEHYLNNMENTWYCVFRRKVLLENFKLINKNKIYFKNLNFYYYVHDAVNYISGKIKKLSIITLLHQYHLNSEINTFLKKDELVDNKYFNSDIMKFHKKLYKTFFNDKKRDLKLIIHNYFFTKKIRVSNVLYTKSILNKCRKKFKISNKNIIYLVYNFFLYHFMKIKNTHVTNFINKIKNKTVKKELISIISLLNRHY